MGPSFRLMRVAFALSATVACAHAQELDGQGRSMLNPIREEALHPAELIARLKLAPDRVIADVGAGPGFFTLPLARAVPQGKVIAGDVKEAYLAVARERARGAGLTNVETQLWPAERPLLAAASIDLAFLCQVDHYFKDRAAYLSALLPSLRPGGRVVLVNFERHRAADLEAAQRLGLTLVDEWRPSPGFFAQVWEARRGVLGEIRARGRLVVSVKNEGAASPSVHHDPAHFQKRNFEVELAHALAGKILGDPAKVELKLMPRAVRLAAVVEDRVDLVVSMIAVTDERKRQVDFSRPYWTDGLALLLRPGLRVEKLEELQGRRLLALRQTANDPSAELQRQAAARGVRFTVERVVSFGEAEAALRAGRADGLVSHAVNIEAWLAAHPGLERSALLEREDYAVAVKKGANDLVRAVNETIDELERSGKLAEMQARAGLR
jgi:putative glutamine transport system substrate-binding protein